MHGNFNVFLVSSEQRENLAIKPEGLEMIQLSPTASCSHRFPLQPWQYGMKTTGKTLPFRFSAVFGESEAQHLALLHAHSGVAANASPRKLA